MPRRSLCRIWRDGKPFRRRVRWYAESPLELQRNIRLEFTDETGSTNRFYGKNMTWKCLSAES